MLRLRTLLFTATVLSTPYGFGQLASKLVKASDRPEFEMVQSRAITMTEADGRPRSIDSKIPGNIVRTFGFLFYNGTKEEVQSVAVRFWVTEHGKTVYKAGPFKIGKFYDIALQNYGGALPNHAAQIAEPVSIDYPSQYWNTESQDHFEMVEIGVRPGGQDLHEIGHLYTWLVQSPDETVLSEIHRDSTLITLKNDRGTTALATAFVASTVPVAKAMVEGGADPHATGPGHLTALHFAAANPKPELMDYAHQLGIPLEVEADYQQTPLMSAITFAQTQNVKWLLDHGASPNHADKGGSTPLFYAITWGQIDSLNLLARAGADLAHHDPNGIGPLQHAARQKGPALVMGQRLVALGISVNDRDAKAGITPLMMAASTQNNELARWLLEHGADLKAKDAKGQSVFDYARMSNTLQTDMFFRREVLDKLRKEKPAPTVPTRKKSPKA